MPLTIAIDFDGTITACPELWAKVIALMEADGHRVVMVTCRSDSEANVNFVREYLRRYGIVLPMLFTSNGSKIEAAKERGWDVDIWCDDQPHTIVHGF